MNLSLNGISLLIDTMWVLNLVEAQGITAFWNLTLGGFIV